MGLATIRLLPAATQINICINSLSYSKESLDLLYNDIKKAEVNEEYATMHQVKSNPFPFNGRLIIQNVSFIYSGTDKVVLDNINFSVRKGESIAISGDSGVGKRQPLIYYCVY